MENWIILPGLLARLYAHHYFSAVACGYFDVSGGGALKFLYRRRENYAARPIKFP
jgi:hypothetical protein